jgi:hypothetical protein
MDITYLLSLVGLTLEGLVYAWPITTVLFLAVFLATLYNSPFTDRDYDRSYLLLLVPSALTILILVCSASSSGGAVVLYLVIAHVPISALLAKRLWRYQWFVVALGVFQMWVSLVAAVIGSGLILSSILLGVSID